MNEESAGQADCYSAAERGAMVWGQNVRARLLRPLLQLLAACGITPDHLTLLSLFVGLAFCPFYFWSKPAAFTAIALHVLIDGLDGPLARYTGVASRRGSFTDSISDQVIVVASTLTLMSAHTIGVAAGGCYVFFYTVVVLFAMARNALFVPYWWLVRPRFFVYAWFLAETYFLPGTIDYVLWLFNTLLALKMLSGFVEIRKRI